MSARFGLDIGRGGVKLLRSDKAGVRVAERAIDAALEGDARRTTVLAALREVALELRVGARDEVSVAIPRAEAIVKCLTLPRVPDPELEGLVRFQAAKDLPFELTDVVLAWGRAGEAASTTCADEVVVAAVRTQAVEEARALLRDAGLSPGVLEVSTHAAARALVQLGGSAAGDEALLVEVGRATTDIIVLDRGRLAFSRSASVGCGLDPAADAAWLERLGQEVARTLVAARSARGSTRTGPPGALFVAGGGAALPALANALEGRIGLRPAVLDALGDGDPARGARFVVARGLVVPAIDGLPCVDLAHRARARGDRQTKLRLVAAGGAVLALIVATTLALEGLGRSRAAAAARLADERTALAPRVARARALEVELALAQRWEARRGRELEVLLCLSRALPEEQAFLTNVRWTDARPMTLAGRAKGWDEVARFLATLGKDPLVVRADLQQISGADAGTRGKEGVEFSGTCELREPPGGAK